MDNWINTIPIILIFAALLSMLVFDDWRRGIISLAVLYLGIFILLVQVLPLTLASVKLITGWMAALLLGLNLPKEELNFEEGALSKRIFKIFGLLFVWVIAFLASKTISSAFVIRQENVFAAVAIFGSGLLQLGMKSKAHFVILGILTVFAGFELLYSNLETSVLINGLLAAITLLIALIGSFFVDFSHQEGHT
ncbi:MAG: hypothetical protein AB9897_02670 [Anaerolineaceae bacterium]